MSATDVAVRAPDVPCPTCRARPGVQCNTRYGTPHTSRIEQAEAATKERRKLVDWNAACQR